MKICFLTDDPFDIGGGPEHIRQVVKLLQKKYAYTVTIITPKTMAENFIFSNPFHRVKYVLWVLKFILTTNYDVYHSHAFSTSLFLPLLKLRGKKTGFTVHGLVYPKLISKLFLAVWRFDIRLSASSYSGYITVGNGVDINEFLKIKHLPHKIFTILCISRRDPVKGTGFLEKAVQQIPNVKLNLVSGRQREMSDFAKADIYVLPSLSEGLPIVILEAMAAKLPIVTTDVGDCSFLVRNAKCGVVIKPGSASELSNAILAMIADKNRSKMGSNGFKYVKENYSWEKVAAIYNSAYSRSNPFV